MAQPDANAARLRAFVSASLDRASARESASAAAGLRRDAARVAQQLRALSAWAAHGQTSVPPAHLEGVSAFHLSDAMEALEAEAWRRDPTTQAPR